MTGIGDIARSAGATIVAEGLARTYPTRSGPATAVRGLDLVVPGGRLLAVVGPSGCGKSTLLRLLAGIERPDAGTLAIADRTVADAARGLHVPPHHRRVGMVFQSFSVWPHLDVAENVAYPLWVQRVGRAERRTRVDEALDLVGLGGLGRRRAHELSGGQQQRVALARAVVQRPEVLLLDEPLSALDAHLRERLGQEIVDLQAALGLTTVYVTHDRREALGLSDEVAVMAGGRIVQQGPPAELRAAPTHRITAELLAESTLLTGRAGRVLTRGEQEVETALGTVVAVGAGGDRPTGTEVTVAVSPGAVRLVDAATDPAPGPTARVLRIVARQRTAVIRVVAGGTNLTLRVDLPVTVVEGQEVRLVTAPDAFRIVADD